MFNKFVDVFLEFKERTKQKVFEIKSEESSEIKSGTTSATSTEALVIQNSKLLMQTSEGNQQIKILPEEASSKATEVTSVTLIILINEDSFPVYSITGTKQGRIVALFPVTLKIETKVNANTGEIISVDKH